MTGKVLGRVQRGLAPAADDALATLSPEEDRVLALVAEGKTNKEIAAALYARCQGQSALVG